jgi:hypothetical protein
MRLHVANSWAEGAGPGERAGEARGGGRDGTGKVCTVHLHAGRAAEPGIWRIAGAHRGGFADGGAETGLEPGQHSTISEDSTLNGRTGAKAGQPAALGAE